ncbi:MAG: hypothetical protein CL578_11305 [Alteromonadaceae bacterium]|jgi:hypothetical protein|uniref:hypothetical protein n=1 Tax=unclassified Methylophaga TaxID=2629249 RepID=UPI000C640EA7|nr:MULTISPECIES: hypothetical protein [unclassified Methylophaga]MAP27943.1 hypothetical protein [Methylophaga sp.]MBN25621.1 hypothetical protein [Alteromonadaceae bacterium]HCN99449.1 hypothetical protein [Methylophaga sp.]|tara:strand:+ start:2197 stop:2724 length:528 start_codon:yes stop_codon:yes gene_type:complete
MEKHREELYSLIGRTVILFQRYEYTFKSLLIRSLIVGTADTLKENFEERSLKIRKKSLGQLVAMYIDEFVTAENNTDVLDSDIYSSQFSIRVSMILDSISKDEMKKMYKSLVDDRNFVIHHLITELIPHDALSYQTMITKLSAINQKFELNLENLLIFHEAVSEGYRQLIEAQRR